MNDILSRDMARALGPPIITVLVYEFASGGGYGTAAAPQSVLAEGRAMRDAACRDLAALPGVAVMAAAATATDQPPGAGVVVPRPDEAAADFLRRSAAGADAVWLIAPESEGIELALSRTLEETDCIRLGSGSDAVAVASSKSKALTLLAASGIATVPTWPLAYAPLHLHETWVLKPDCGCGCESMRRMSWRSAEAERQSTRRAHDTIAQPWLDGEAMSLSLLVRQGEATLLSINSQSIAIAADGSLSLAGIDRDVTIAPWHRAALHGLACDIARTLPGLAGFVGIDFILAPDGQAVVLEVNPRLTSAFVGLSRRLGRNLAADVLRSAIPRFARA